MEALLPHSNHQLTDLVAATTAALAKYPPKHKAAAAPGQPAPHAAHVAAGGKKRKKKKHGAADAEKAKATMGSGNPPSGVTAVGDASSYSKLLEEVLAPTPLLARGALVVLRVAVGQHGAHLALLALGALVVHPAAVDRQQLQREDEHISCPPGA